MYTIKESSIHPNQWYVLSPSGAVISLCVMPLDAARAEAARLNNQLTQTEVEILNEPFPLPN